MTTHSSFSSSTGVDSPFQTVLHSALDVLAKALGSQLNAVIGQQLDRQAERETIEKHVIEVMPELLEKAFIVGFLEDNKKATRQRRAILSHLLSSAELLSVNGGSPVVVPPVRAGEVPETMTSQEAAKLLNVSRTHLNKLVNAGRFGDVARTEGGHRRISKAEVLKYQASSKARQTEGLKQMAEASNVLGLYDGELAGLPVRTKR